MPSSVLLSNTSHYSSIPTLSSTRSTANNDPQPLSSLQQIPNLLQCLGNSSRNNRKTFIHIEHFSCSLSTQVWISISFLSILSSSPFKLPLLLSCKENMNLDCLLLKNIESSEEFLYYQSYTVSDCNISS